IIGVRRARRVEGAPGRARVERQAAGDGARPGAAVARGADAVLKPLLPEQVQAAARGEGHRRVEQGDGARHGRRAAGVGDDGGVTHGLLCPCCAACWLSALRMRATCSSCESGWSDMTDTRPPMPPPTGPRAPSSISASGYVPRSMVMSITWLAKPGIASRKPRRW